MFKVDTMNRTGKVDTTRFFTENNAKNFYDMARTNGQHIGGAISAGENSRILDFGLFRGGVSVRKARAEYRKLYG